MSHSLASLYPPLPIISNAKGGEVNIGLISHRIPEQMPGNEHLVSETVFSQQFRRPSLPSVFFSCPRELLASASDGPDPLLHRRNEDGLTPCHVACMRGYSSILLLLSQYAELDTSLLDANGDPPIFYCAASGSLDCLRILISCGADVNARLKEGVGAPVTHICATHGYPDCLEVSHPFSAPFPLWLVLVHFALFGPLLPTFAP